LIDGHLLDLPQGVTTLLQCGYQALKERCQVRDSLAPCFNELGLAGMISEYAINDIHAYIASINTILVVDTRTHEIVREINCPCARASVIGSYNRTLYIESRKSGNNSLVSVSLSVPTTFSLLVDNVYCTHLYKNFLCYMEQEDSKWNVIDLDSETVVRTFGVEDDSTFYECHDRHIFDTVHKVCYDLTSGQVYSNFGTLRILQFIGTLDKNLLLLDAHVDLTPNNRLVSYNIRTGQIVIGESLFDKNVKSIGHLTSLLFNGLLFVSYCELTANHNVIQAFDPQSLMEVGTPCCQSCCSLGDLYVDQRCRQFLFTQRNSPERNGITLVFMSLDDQQLTSLSYQIDERYDRFIVS
jgi:hypothetical protein